MRDHFRQCLSRPVYSGTILLAMICMLDLAATIVLLRLNIAKEANPILIPYLNHSLGAFVAAKTFFSIGPLVGLEMVGWIYPSLSRLAIRVGIFGYLGVYVLGSLGIHGLL